MRTKKRKPKAYQVKMAMADRYQAYGNYNPQVQHLVSRQRPNLREIRMGLPLTRGLQGTSFLNAPEYGLLMSGGHMGNFMRQVENSANAVDYSKTQEEADAVARELRDTRLAIAGERAAFEQAQMGKGDQESDGSGTFYDSLPREDEEEEEYSEDEEEESEEEESEEEEEEKAKEESEEEVEEEVELSEDPQLTDALKNEGRGFSTMPDVTQTPAQQQRASDARLALSPQRYRDGNPNIVAALKSYQESYQIIYHTILYRTNGTPDNRHDFPPTFCEHITVVDDVVHQLPRKPNL
jgi:hypothetical protein